MRLANWDNDDVRIKTLELEQFLSEHSIHICFQNETHPETGRIRRFTNYVCHWMDRPTWGRTTAILVRRGTAVPALGLQHLEANAIHLVLVT